MVTQQISDTELLLQIKENDHASFDLLFDRYWERLYRAALARVGDDSVAQDIVQELFISIWERRAEISLTGNFEQYLTGAVKFKVISTIRNRAVKERVFNELRMRMTGIEENQIEKAVYPDLDKTMNDALLSLNEHVRAAFLLRSDNLTIREIASQLGLQEQTVRNYIADALQRIRAVVKHKYGDDPILYSCVLFAFVNDYLTQSSL